MIERWGTFSVRDHIFSLGDHARDDFPYVNNAPFVSEVLLYDRLVIPVPPSDNSRDEFWRKFDPQQQQECLDILKVKTDEKDGLALTVPWDAAKEERFNNRISTAAALVTQQLEPEQPYYSDPFEMTRQLIKEEFRPALPKGVANAWPVAAYNSSERFRQEVLGSRS